MSKLNGSIIGSILNYQSPSGVFSLLDQYNHKLSDDWGPRPTPIEYLIVSGGGSGGQGYYIGGGGGGAGGIITGIAPYTATELSGQLITAVVGAGGAGSTTTTNAGSLSSISVPSLFDLSVIGGGRAATNSPSDADGACGGGMAGTVTTYQGGTGSVGFDGGANAVKSGSAGTDDRYGGGGGGMGSAGGDAVMNVQGGDGGDGLPYDISGPVVYYAAGGGGGCWGYTTSPSAGSGGLGGGGDGTVNGGGGQHATVNSGSGGGGASSPNQNRYAGGNGGSGIIILKTLAQATYSDAVETNIGDYFIYTFTGSGSIVF